MLRQQYDYVIVDTPPVLAVTDSTAVGARGDGVLLCVRVRRGCRSASMRACEVLRDVNPTLIGIVVNAVDKSSFFAAYKNRKGYGYGYRYGYHEYTSEQYREADRDSSSKRLQRAAIDQS